jgi:protein TonB
MNYHFPQADFLSRRALAFSGIAAFHILIAYLLLTALVQAPPRKTDPHTVGIVLARAPEPPVKFADFRPSEHRTRILVPDPELLSPAENPSQMSAVIEQAPSAGAAVVAAPAPVRVLGANQLPNSEDYYPPDMRRLNIQGATDVRVCVDAQGARVGEPTIEESSGFARLDTGAVNVAKHGRYARSMQGDTPVGNCFRIRVAFKIPK